MKLRWYALALTELRAVHAYFNKFHGAAAAKSFVLRVAEATGRMLNIPTAGRRSAIKGMRLFAVPGAPWIIVYRVRGETVDILGFVHTAGRDRPRS